MTEPKFIPGPWRVAPFCDDRRGLAFVEAGWQPEREDGSYDSEIIVTTSNHADAHLIAAAPDLYAELEELVDHLNEVREEFRANGVVLPNLRTALAVLAKARGEAP
jgi:hypothetical protein